MLRNCYPRKLLAISTEASLSHIFVTVALYGGAVGKPDFFLCIKLNNRAARIVTNSSYVASADALIEKLDWLTISEIIKRETATMVYKSLNGFVPMYFSNIFSRNSTRDTIYLRNSENDLQMPLFKTANGQKSFAYHGAHLWNNLESEVNKAPSLFVFKRCL